MSKLALVFNRICIVFFLWLGLGTGLSYAQPQNPSSDPDVPITGIEILVGLGGLLGIKKIHDLRKKR